MSGGMFTLEADNIAMEEPHGFMAYGMAGRVFRVDIVSLKLNGSVQHIEKSSVSIPLVVFMLSQYGHRVDSRCEK